MAQDFDIQADLQIRHTRGWACLPLIITCFVFMAGFAIAVSPLQGRRFRLEEVDWFGVFLLVLATAIFAGIVYHMRDRSVKLLLTPTGLEDYRTGVSIKWADVYGVRLVITTLVPSGEVLRALIVKAPVGDEIKDVVIDVKHLDVPAESIADFAHRQSLKVLADLLASAVTIEWIRTELTAGRALSDLTTALCARGFAPHTAKRAVELVAGSALARCPRCRLRYLGHVRACAACDERLTPCDPDQ